MAAWEVDELLNSRFRVRECVRQSSTGHVYRVDDLFRGTAHLVLRPSPRFVMRRGWRERFQSFCEDALAVPPHENVLDCQRLASEGDVPFLLMEDVEGECWDSAIFDGRLGDLPTMLEVARQVASGVAWLHAHDLIHYNVKPANVWVTDTGLAKVWKYGEANAKTRVYASPEQMTPGRSLSEATDVWSWAVSVLHMFVGRAAWQRGTEAPAVLRRYMQNGPAVKGLPLMPGPLAAVLAECLKKNRDRRTITMEEVAERVGELQGRAFGPNDPDALDAPEDPQESSSEADEQPAPTGD
jgi:serine/threonine protein kinase